MNSDTDGTAERLVAEWVERRRAGEDLPADDWVARHPHVADELRAGIAAFLQLGEVLPPGAPEAPPRRERIGEYRVLREIGRGGMGVVYEAEQPAMNRRVALKVLYPSITNTSESVERFRREARAAGSLKHTNIVTVHQLGEDTGVWFCAMELVDGHSLDRVLEDVRRMRPAPRGARRAKTTHAPPTTTAATPSSQSSPSSGAAGTWMASTGERRYFGRVAEMFAEIADALQLAHDHGVVHRDIKPANLMVSADGRLRILDFGLARMREERSGLTVTGGIVGTPSYMSPEQARSAPVDARSDVYSLGATLYEVLTLRPPFHAKDIADVLQKLRAEEPRPPTQVDGRIPRDLETIVLKALEKDATRRYATAGDLARDLRGFAEGRTISARRVGHATRAWRVARRNRLPVALAAALLVAVAGAAVYARVATVAREEREAERAERMRTEYERLLVEADGAEEYTPGADDGHATSEPLREAYARAIAVAPDRPEAYLGRALASFDLDVEARLADVDAAAARGLPATTAQLARAVLLSSAGQHADGAAAARAVPADADLPAEALLLRAELAGGEGRTADALRDLGEALAKGGDRRMRVRALLTRGNIRYALEDWTGALEDMVALRAVSASPGAINVDVQIAWLWTKVGATEDAEARIEALIADCERIGALEPWLRMTDCLTSWKRAAWALKVTERALRQYPDNRELLLARARALPPAEGVALCDRLIAAHRAWHPAWCQKGRRLLELGQPDAAIDALTEARRLDGTCAATLRSLADARAKQRRYDDAIAMWEESFRHGRLDYGSRIAYASTLLQSGRPADALAALDRALADRPFDVDAATARVTVLLQLKRLDEALTAATDAARRHPESRDAAWTLANALVAAGRDGDAEAPARRALALPESGPNPLPDAACRARIATVLRVLGRYGEALQVLADDPRACDDSLECLLERAYLRVITQDWRAAVEDTELYLRRDPGDAFAQSLRGFALKELGQFERAVEAYRAALARASAPPRLVVDGPAARTFHVSPQIDVADTRARLSESLLLCGRTDEALVECDAGIAAHPREFSFRVGKAKALLLANRPDDALRCADEALADAPDLPRLHEVRGRALERVGRRNDAVAAMDRAVALCTTDDAWDVLASAGQVYGRAGRLDQALRALERATALRPHLGLTFGNLVAVHVLAGQLDEAERLIRAEIDWAPQDPDLRGRLADIFQRRGDSEGALAEFRKAVGVAPQDAGAARNLAACLWALDRRDEAVAELQRLADAGSDDAALHAELGNGLAVLGRHEQAVAAWERALALAPNDVGNRNTVAWYLATTDDRARRDPARAVKLAREAVDLAPVEGAIQNTLGVALCAAGAWKESLEVLGKSMELRSGGDANDWYFVAIARKRLGDDAQAREWFDKAVAWRKAHAADDEELARFEREAAEVLGIAVASDRAPAHAPAPAK